MAKAKRPADRGHIKDLVPDPDNTRQHTPRGVGIIVDALQKLGAGRGVVVSGHPDRRNKLLAGHATVEAAAEAGVLPVRFIDTDGKEIIAIRRSDLSEADERLLSIADNRAGEFSSWRAGSLEEVFKTEEVGWMFTEHEVHVLGGEEPSREDADDLPKPRRTSITAGDLFELGEHRLVCGDCRIAETVGPLLGMDRAHMMWTDPPYGVDYQGRTKRALKMANDLPADLAGLLADGFATADKVIVPGAPIYMAHPTGENAITFMQAFIDVGWHFQQGLVWVKNSMTLGRDYRHQHEALIYGWKKGKERPWYAGNSERSRFDVDRPPASAEHPTCKPVALIEPHLRNSSKEGDRIYDPFAGWGSTMIAAEELQRRAFLVEIDPVYCQAMIDRWETFTQLRAVKVGGRKKAAKKKKVKR